MADSRVHVALDDLLDLRAADTSSFYRNVLSVHHDLPGDTRSPSLGRGVEFSEVRLYQPGDDIRTIDWRASARSTRPYTRLYTVERERQVQIIVDQRASMFFGSREQFKSVLAAKLATLAAWSALTHGYRIGGQVVAENLMRVRGLRARAAVLQLINAIHMQNHSLCASSTSTATLLDIVMNGMKSTRHGTEVIVVSDFHDLDEQTADVLARFGQNRRVIMIGVYDELERALSVRGTVGISNGPDSRSTRIGSAQSGQFSQQQELRIKRVQQCANEARASLFWANTHDTVSTCLQQWSAHG